MSQWHTVRFVDEPTVVHATEDARIHRIWPKYRGRKVRVRFWGNADKYWAIFVNASGCDCNEFFEVKIPAWGHDNLVCRRMLEMD